MSRKIKGIGIIVIVAMLLQMIPMALGIVFADDIQAVQANEEGPIWYIRENFGAASSWDKARAWNGTNYYVGSGVAGLELVDNSTTQKSEAYRALNIINSGVLTFDYDFKVDRATDNVAFRLLNDTNTVFGIVTKGSNLYLEQPNDELLYLSDYSVSLVNKDVVNYVVAHIDMDNKRIKDIYINGVKCVEDKPFATDADKINGFDAETGVAEKVVLSNQRIYLNKGYILNEDFFNAQKVNPLEWNFESDGGTTSVYSANNRNADRHSMQMNTTAGGLKTTRQIDAVGGHLVYETSVLQPKKRDGVKISLNNGENSVISVITDGTQFCYAAQEGNVPFYNYLSNAWCKIKFDLDLNNSTAKVYFNNKLKAENVKLNDAYKTIDNIVISAEKNDNPVIIDDIKLYHPQEIGDDYVPAPEKPEKVDEGIVIGMQMCPLWTEGLYTKSWDYVKAAPDRVPILGCYDEGTPETSDWIIKWLADHGYDFEWVCHYPSYQMSFAANAVPSPMKPDMCRDGNSIYEGFMNAKYSDDFKFAIVMENSFLGQGTAIRDYFYDALVPYWIEYYFKDDRYLKIDGRPVLGIYLMDNFLNMFEGTDGLTGTEGIKAGVDKFRQMCVDAGVGDPYIVAQGNSYPGKAYAYYSQCGIDGINAYGYDQKATVGQQRQILEEGLKNTDQYGFDTVPSLVPRRGDDPWLNGQNAVGFKSTTEEFEDMLNWVKEAFAGGQKSKLSKQVVMTATWDEFGEGHTLCPNAGDGFKYLDCIRDVFTKNPEHEDAIPTEAQKARVNHLVVQERKTGDLTDGLLRYQILERPKPEIPETVKMEWDFTKTTADGNEWAKDSGISTDSLSSVGWTLQPSNTTPTIAISKKISYDISDVTYIRIRMKQSKYSTGGYAYWTSTVSPEADTKAAACHFSASVDDSEEFRDYYIPVGEKVRWNGNLTSLKINLGVLTDKSDSFIVQSIAFLSDDELTKKAKVCVDGANFAYSAEPVMKDGVVMLPLRETAEPLGLIVENYARTNSYLITSNNVMVTEGSTKASKNNKEFELEAAPYRVSEIVNDTVYVPMNVFSEALPDRKFSYDATNKVLNVESKKEETKIVNRKILAELRGGDQTAFYSFEGMNSVKYDKNTTILDGGGYAIALTRALQGVNLADVKYVAFKFNVSSAGTFKFLYNSKEDSLISADKISRTIPVTAGENYIEEPTSNLFQWEGTSDILRFQPAPSKVTELEYIRFLGDPLPTKEGAADMSSCMTFGEGYCGWDFDKNTEYDGWIQNKSIGSTSLSNGVFGFKIAGSNPVLTTGNSFSIDSSKVKSIEIALKNGTSGKKLRLNCLAKNEKNWNNSKAYDLEISSNDQYDRVYTIDVKDIPSWNGIINKMMLSFDGKKGDVSIDYIKLNYVTE